MKTVINAGELRDTLIVQKLVADGGIDENGFPVEGIVDLYTLRCKKKTVTTKEYISADRDTTDLTYKFICRNRNIDNTMLVKYKNKTFNIKHVHELDYDFVEITATEQI